MIFERLYYITGRLLRIYNFDHVTLRGVVDTSAASEKGAESIYINAPILTVHD